MLYQTRLYRAVLTDHGWDTDKIIFISRSYINPTDAMFEFSFCEPSHPNWFATMLEMDKGKVLDEEIFDSSVMVFEI